MIPSILASYTLDIYRCTVPACGLKLIHNLAWELAKCNDGAKMSFEKPSRSCDVRKRHNKVRALHNTLSKLQIHSKREHTNHVEFSYQV